MKKTTHQIVSLGIFLLCSRIFEWEFSIIVIGCLISLFIGVINDLLDYKLLFGVHRNFLTHSPISPVVLVIFFGFWFVGEVIRPGRFSLIFALIITGIFELHIFLDMFNPSGIPIIPGKFIRIRAIPYDDFKLNICMTGLGLVFSALGIFY